MLDVKPIREDSFDCLQGVVVSAARYFNRDYAGIFADSWGMDYSRRYAGKASLSERLKQGGRLLNFQILKDYHGIELVAQDMDVSSNFTDTISSELAYGRPVIVETDAFYCPWMKSFMKYHAVHFCLVVGCEDTCFLCIDTYSAGYSGDCFIDFSRPFKFRFIDMERAYKKLLLFKLSEEKGLMEDRHIIIGNSIRNIVLDECGYNLFDEIRELSGEFDFCSIMNEMESSRDMYDVPLMRSLKDIGCGRRNYSMLVNYLSKKLQNDGLARCSGLLVYASDLWYKLRMKIIKSGIAGNSKSSSIDFQKNLLEIADVEEKIFIEYLDCMKAELDGSGLFAG